MTSPTAAFQLLIAALNRLGIQFVVAGSLASSVHGLPRATMDVDLIADLRLDHLDRLARELTPAFYADLVMMRDALLAGQSFNVIHYKSAYKFDIFPVRDAFTRAQLARSEIVESPALGDEPVRFPVASPEDTVLAKLHWYKMSGGALERQWRDILGVLAIKAASLDRAYLDEWAPQLGVAGLLEEAFLQAADTLNPSARPRPQTPSS